MASLTLRDAVVFSHNDPLETSKNEDDGTYLFIFIKLIKFDHKDECILNWIWNIEFIDNYINYQKDNQYF